VAVLTTVTRMSKHRSYQIRIADLDTLGLRFSFHIHPVFILTNISSSESVEITNKMQPCNIIYYSNVYWRLNMFRAAYHSSSGAPNCICSLWFTYTCGDRRLSRLSGCHNMCI